MIRVGGKRIRQSLKTKVLTVAKLRLGDLEKRERANLAGQAKLGEVMRVLHLVKLWRERLEADRAIRPRTKTYYQERLAVLLKNWPSLAASDVRKINARDCQSWAGKYAKEVSSSSFNNTIGLLRRPVAPNVRVGDCARFALRHPRVGKYRLAPIHRGAPPPCARAAPRAVFPTGPPFLPARPRHHFQHPGNGQIGHHCDLVLPPPEALLSNAPRGAAGSVRRASPRGPRAGLGGRPNPPGRRCCGEAERRVPRGSGHRVPPSGYGMRGAPRRREFCESSGGENVPPLKPGLRTSEPSRSPMANPSRP